MSNPDSPVLASFLDCIQRLDNLVTIDQDHLHPDHPNRLSAEQWNAVLSALDAVHDRVMFAVEPWQEPGEERRG